MVEANRTPPNSRHTSLRRESTMKRPTQTQPENRVAE
jgi:hypothetical protein